MQAKGMYKAGHYIVKLFPGRNYGKLQCCV